MGINFTASIIMARPSAKRYLPSMIPRRYSGALLVSSSSHQSSIDFSYRRFIQSIMKRCHSTINKTFSHLHSPTSKDVQELFCRMDFRPGSILTTIKNDENNTFTDSNNYPTVVSSNHLNKYNIDWTKHWSGNSAVVVFPISTQEVARVLQYCHQHKIGIVPQGGNTGLVGGSIPIKQEIVISLEKMNQIHNNNEDEISSSNILRVDAGCILQDIQDYASTKMNCLVPVDLGAKGTCQIGGNISTNAGGVYYYRYGSLHANCIGLEVVIPPTNNSNDDENQILNLGYHPVSHLKDNTGYDLKHLFIGGEGTIGIITKIALLCPPKPTSIGAVWLTCHSLQGVIQILNLARTQYLNEILAAFEFMDQPILRLVQTTHGDSGNPPVGLDDSTSTYSILVETHGSNEGHDQEKLEAFVEAVMEKGLVTNGVVAQNMSQGLGFWNIREMCNAAAAATGYVYKFDVSLAPTDFDSFIHEIKSKLSSAQTNDSSKEFICVNWGHIIDGNLHCNIVSPGMFEMDSDLSNYIEKSILDAVMKRNGSISAEHGLGQYKNRYMKQIKEQPTLQAMHAIKDLFDPHGIMNPGKYLPED